MGPRCEVVYFRGVETIVLGDVRARPFHKGDDPERLVCFCFGHSADAVIRDVREHGTSTIRVTIAAACKSGRHDCEHANPQGRCCLGNVGQLIATAHPQPAQPVSKVRRGRSPALALAGAVVAALLSSACCWLPLLAVALGTSAAGVGSFFAAWRIPLLVVAALLLGVGFFLVYRKPTCAPGDACARFAKSAKRLPAPYTKARRFNRIMLWSATVLMGAAALFPDLMASLSSRGDAVPVAAPSQSESSYRLDGMTCAGCATDAREALIGLRGVVHAQVSYEARRATVVWRDAPDHGAVGRAMDAIGVRSTLAP